ncbi:MULTISPECIES: PAS domain-containing sensor histidine kinase [unclassified Rhizobium]|uniref:sensor histidine kinase n=1 Tax=unclassified Rhizobium TaxID=2613769 RepID=UPI001C8374D6|nr:MULTISPECIES: PAS domain-containing sensor histidine kinase [unclassified Rhizobium]MBX5214097.1 PAS domain-containing sensor histidine kinase [Rhizobium sp. NLR9a]MBX5245785.1 PAS domain-containing sensor histidine kinase [Rhizobium sp. NLR3b]MBX5273977.1 PAS domain-containing sensor histidine kinase [Rhizobium sp. NLR13a]MBX5279473.1 PAS domain-containing sensor histidine kinase [Rhizobium sp. NLR10a]MBX5291387.1 PAS domain-containing sensor histidine kinase [Rhizobium sp. NLR15a]
MPAVQYPFIDIAVHARVRERFSRGEAMVLFSADLARLLWANGAGAELFGHSAVYDLLDQGADRTDITFRQLETAARQLADIGDNRSLMIRVAKGFQRVQVQAAAELIRLSSGEKAILFSVPVSARPLTAGAAAAQMLQGLDDPDTHMAVIGANGEVIAASPGFASLAISGETAKALINLAGAHPDRLVKRPVATGRGYLPAAVGRLSDEPSLNLLFAVETAIGHLDPTDAPVLDAVDAPPQAADAPAREEGTSSSELPPQEAAAATGFGEIVNAVSGIEEVEETLEEIADDREQPAEAAATTAEAAVADENPTATEAAENDDATESRMDEADEPAAPVDEAASHSVDETAEATAMAGTPAETSQMPRDEAPDAAREEPAIAADAPPPASLAPEPGFVFRPNSRATRFVWKIDAEGRFNEVSHEFAEAVGPHASAIIGSAFSDIAALFNLDPDGKISEALARRDTWSGKTILWPVEGTSLVVPVDLAALPTYTRSRDFDGFRGFGVVRLSDTQEDPLALGLTLGPDGVGHDAAGLGPAADAVSEPAHEIDAAPEAAPAETIAADVIEDHPQIEETPFEAAGGEAGFEPPTRESAAEEVQDGAGEGLAADAADEPPALRIVETPNRRSTDKVVQLHSTGAALTAAEQANFREIAKRLEAFGARREEPDTPAPTGTAATEPAAFEESAAPEAFTGETPGADTPDTASAEEIAPQEAIFEKAAESLREDGAAEEPAAITEDEATEGLEETVSQIEVLTSFIPPRVKMIDGLSAGTVDQLPVAVLIHVGDALIHANPEFMRLTGYQSLDALREVGGIEALLQRRELEEKAAGSGTMMLVKADDTLTPVTARLQSVRWEDANALMLALMPVEGKEDGRGDSNRSEARPERMVEKVAKLQVEVEELRSILETATDGVVVIGTEGDIRSMNRSASALFNYDEQETRGKPFVMLFAHESQKAVLDYLNGLAGHGVASVLNDGREVIGREAGGGFVPLFMTMGRLTSSNGYCAVIRDITQWKRTEDELRNAKGAAETANAHKTDFLARVSHEIRTPLNAIIGFSDMMAGERFGPIGHPRYIEYANDIGRSGRHVLDIVNDLLDISKIEAGEMDLDFAAVGLNEAVSEAVALVQPQANGQRVIIRTALSHSVPEVVADLRSIKQIALNILSNAIRFTPSGGQIVVSTSYEANGSVVLRVRDTGIGMTRAELDHAMKPFRQVSSTQSRHRGDGTGLGLPLTKAMVDANRATFSINSAPNEGTLVEITFPSQRVLAG